MTPLLDSNQSSVDRLVSLYKRTNDILFDPNASKEDAHEYFNYIYDHPEEMQVLLLNRTVRIWHIREAYERSIQLLEVEPYTANKGISSIIQDWNTFLYKHSSPREHLEYLRLVSNKYYQTSNPEELWNNAPNSVEYILQRHPITVREAQAIALECLDEYKQWVYFSLQGCYDSHCAQRAHTDNKLHEYRNDPRLFFQNLRIEDRVKVSTQAISKLVRETNAASHAPLNEEWTRFVNELLTSSEFENTREQFLVLYTLLSMKPALYAAMQLYGIADEYSEEQHSKLKHMTRTLLRQEQQQNDIGLLLNEGLNR